MAEAFQLTAGHLALDFANTLDNRYDPKQPLELLPTYERFLAFGVQCGIINRQQMRRLLLETNAPEARRVLKRAVELREASYVLFKAVAAGRPADRSSLRILNRFLVEARVPEAIVWHRPHFTRRCRDLAGTPAGPLWPIIDAAASLLTSPDRYHVRECREETCRWLFLDRSKNHSRRWCDMRICGNRSKARRFHARLRSGA
ncbi:MAG TPA: ABATE domain-containing protein [Candidatus Acidoferrales bacterium]|nr:ABATE domain-containing protein [Candidatus Acidoferrales bacterium]